MSSIQPCVVYRAAAGSGKTYTLTQHFLDRILQRPEYPTYFKHIVALTFTNKAAQEMKQRILDALAVRAKGGDSGFGGVAAPADRLLAERTLHHILHGYHDFSVSTLDAFFQRFVHAFLIEMGLSGDYTLRLDSEQVLTEVIDRLLAAAGKDTPLTAWLLRFIEQKMQEGRTWNVRKDLHDFGQELLREGFKKEQLSFEKADFHRHIRALETQLVAEKKRYEAAVTTYADKMQVLLEQYELCVEDFPYKRSGYMGVLSKIEKRQYKDLLLAVRARRLQGVLSGEEKGYALSSPKKQVIQQVLRGGLEDLLRETVAYVEEEASRYQTIGLLQGNVYMLGLTQYMLHSLRDLRSEEDIVLISDVSDILQQLTRDNPSPYVYEKLGTFYAHYFVDECQDTSLFQWESIYPLLSDGLAEGRENYLFGDLKQSIYRWRNASPIELFGSMEERWTGRIRYENMDKNWRSAEKIVQFNNAFFEQVLPLTQAVLRKEGVRSDALQCFDMSYAHIRQEACRRVSEGHPQGYVRVEGLMPEEGTPSVADWTLAQLKECFAHGYSARDICLLVRRKQEAAELARVLLQAHYTVLLQEGLQLSHARSVGFLVAAFRWVEAPGERLHVLHMQHMYRCLGTEETRIDNFDMPSDFPPREALQGKLQGFQRQSLYALGECLIDFFKLHRYQQEYTYLQAFQSLLLSFSKEKCNDLSAFLEWWAQEGYRENLSPLAVPDAIQIRTIHKAKGLEFPVVIVPYCQWRLDHEKNPRLWCALPEELDAAHIPIYPLTYKKSMEDSLFQQEYYAEKAKAYLDSLNLLYVAFTRARDELRVCFTLPRTEKKRCTQVSDLLLPLLWEEEGDFTGAQRESGSSGLCFQYGEAHRKSSKTAQAGAQKDMQEGMQDTSPEVLAEVLETYISTMWQDKKWIRVSKDRYAQSAYAQQGKRMHALLSRMRTMADFPALLAQLDASPAILDAPQWKRRLTQFFAKEAVKDWFSGGWTLRTEAPILRTDGMARRPDRVLTKNDEVHVLDFKTGEAKKKDIEQMREYMELVGQIEPCRCRGFVLYLEKGEVREVSAGA